MKLTHALLLVPLVFGCIAPATRVEEETTTLEPTQARVTLDAGMAALGSGEVEHGIALCEEALLLAEGNQELTAEAHSWLVHGYTRIDEPEPALDHAVCAIELRPNDPWLRYAQGVALQKLGLLDDALDSFDQAIELNPQHVKAVQWRAYIEQIQERFGASLEDWQLALEILERASVEALASWGGDKAALIETCERGIAECKRALGE